MKIQRLLFLGAASLALAHVNAQSDNGGYGFTEERGAAQSSGAVEPTFELLRTSYVAPASPTASTPTSTAAGVPAILTSGAAVVPAATPAKSECASACNAMFKPVCGSDGKTYSNSCMLSIAQCEKPDAKITMKAGGTCVEGSTTPASTPAATTPSGSGSTLPTTAPVGETTPAPTQSPEQPAPGTPAPSESKCTQMCSSDFTPLCGSDGKTYSNACALSVAQCQSPSATIAKVADGECASGSSGSTTPAPATETPAPAPASDAPAPVSDAPATPATPAKCGKMCTADYNPVCGSNGKTYSNSCMLSIAQCGSPTVSITKASDGACGSGASVTTAPATPVTDAPVTPAAGGTTPAPVSVPSATKPNQVGAPKCEMACSKIYAPVCGSNDKTYSNACLLRLYNCKSGIKRTITIQSEGACSKGSSGSITVKPSGSAATGTSTSGGSTSTSTSTTTTGTSTTAGVPGGKDNYLRGSGAGNSDSNSPFQGQ